MDKELRWRVIYGYKPNEYLSIGEDQIELAMYAKISGKVFMGEKMIDGKEIKIIERDFRFYTGWYDTYAPSSGDDTRQMERDMPSKFLFTDREEQADQRVALVMQKNNPALLNDLRKLDQLLLA